MTNFDAGLHYPIRLDELPDSWIYGYVRDFCLEIQSGFACGTHSETDIGIPHLRPMNISREGKLDLSALKYVPEDKDGKRLQTGDVLFNNTNSPELIGKTAYVESLVDGFAFSNHMTRLQFSKSINSRFAAFQLHFLWMTGYFLHHCVKHVNQASISSGELGRIVPFLVPPVNEQNRILDKIEELSSELDKGIEYLKTAREQLKVHHQSVLKQAFEGKLTEQWREAHGDQLETADHLLERIKQEREHLYQQQMNEWEEAIKAWEENGKEGKKPSKLQMPMDVSSLTKEELAELPVLPEKWCWVKLSFLAGRIQIGPFGSLLHRSDYISNGIPIVNPVHIKNQRIEPDWGLTVTQKKLNEVSNYIMRTSDIVMGRRGEMGRCAVITQEENGFLCGSGSLFIRLLPSTNPNFYCYLLSSQRLKIYLSDQSIGTTMQNLNQEIIYNISVPLCTSFEMQKAVEEIDRRITLISEAENTIEENLQKAGILRQGILKKAFSGQLVPQNPMDESAAVLLEIIREGRRYQEKNQNSISKPRRQVPMKKDLSIIEVLQELNGMATAKDIWQKSKYQEDIEGFYAELKKEINNGEIEEVEQLREEKKSYLKLKK